MSQLTLKNGAPLSELRFGGMQALSSGGEINAYDRKDLLANIQRLVMASESGEIVKTTDRAEAKRLRNAALAEAQLSKENWASLGSTVAAKLTEVRNRDGLMRRLMLQQPLAQGELAFVDMPRYDAVAVVAVDSSTVGYQRVTTSRFQAQEFEINANVAVYGLDLQQVGGDLLDHAYNEGINGTMVKEDRLWKAAADRSVGVVNPLTYISGDLTPKMLMQLQQGVSDWNLPATRAVISNDYWQDLCGNDFSSWFDPVTKYDMVLNGVIGTMMGMQIITDGYRVPTQKVLGKGEIYIVSEAEHHGVYTDRGGITSSPTDGTHEGSTRKGWFFNEYLSLTLGNPRSVSKGVRK